MIMHSVSQPAAPCPHCRPRSEVSLIADALAALRTAVAIWEALESDDRRQLAGAALYLRDTALPVHGILGAETRRRLRWLADQAAALPQAGRWVFHDEAQSEPDWEADRRLPALRDAALTALRLSQEAEELMAARRIVAHRLGGDLIDAAE